jgi:hypothetical protein
MPFQRENITLESRIHIVTTILSQPKQYGLVSRLAGEYNLSRQSIYTMLQRSQRGLADSLRPRPPGRVAAAQAVNINKSRLDRAIVTLTVAAHASLEGIQGCLEEMFELHRSKGYISGVLDQAAVGARAFLEQMCPPDPIRADLDEIFAGSRPHLVAVDHDSMLILSLECSDSRDSTAWGVTLLDQQARGVVLAEAASDGALGIAGGLKEAAVECVHLGDLFHVERDLMRVAGQLEKAAYGALKQEEQELLAAAEAQAIQPRRGPKRKPKLKLEDALSQSRRAMQSYDDYCYLVGVVREVMEPVDGPSGKLHRSLESREDLRAVVALLQEWQDHRVTRVAGRLDRAIDGLVIYQDQLAKQLAPWIAQLGEDRVALICWSWRYRKGLGLMTPEALEKAFPEEQQTEVKAIWAALDNTHRASSLVECINSLLRPHLLVHRGADQGLLDLLACYYNHRVFSRGKRRGQSPLQLAGIADEGDWLSAIGFAAKGPVPSMASEEMNPQPQIQSVNRLAA